MVTLPEPESGTKRPKPTTPKKALAILRCLYGSEMVLSEVVIRKCEAPNISQEDGHGILKITCQFVAYN